MSASLTRFLLRAAALTLVVGALAWWLVGLLDGAEARAAVPWAAAVAFVGAALGRLAGLLVPQGTPEAPAQAALVGLGVRLLATAALAFAALQGGVAPAATFAIVLGALYLALLVLEVAQAAADVRSAGRQRPPTVHTTPHHDGSGAAG